MCEHWQPAGRRGTTRNNKAKKCTLSHTKIMMIRLFNCGVRKACMQKVGKFSVYWRKCGVLWCTQLVIQKFVLCTYTNWAQIIKNLNSICTNNNNNNNKIIESCLLAFRACYVKMVLREETHRRRQNHSNYAHSNHLVTVRFCDDIFICKIQYLQSCFFRFRLSLHCDVNIWRETIFSFQSNKTVPFIGIRQKFKFFTAV